VNEPAPDPEEPDANPDDAPPDAPEQQAKRRARFGCLPRAVAVVAGLLALFVVLGLIFGGDGDESGTSSGFNAGDAELYQRSDVSYLDAQHVYVSRLADGTFYALYDLSPKQQELGSTCRIRFDEDAVLATLPQLEGFEGAFVEACEDRRTVWRADGQLDSGAGYGDLDQFATRIGSEGQLLIDLSERSCTRSRGVPGIPPYDVRTCRHP
jgi:hypothetical protein